MSEARSPAPPAAASRPSVIQLVFREKAALYAAYMPLLTDGGLFVPTTRDYKLGEDIYLLLTLPEDPQRYPVAGKVAWVTPANASGGRTQGVGVRFPGDEKTRLLKLRIEEIPYLALDDAALTRRLVRALPPPSEAQIVVNNGVAQVGGSAPAPWIVAFTERAGLVAGIRGVDTS